MELTSTCPSKGNNEALKGARLSSDNVYGVVNTIKKLVLRIEKDVGVTTGETGQTKPNQFLIDHKDDQGAKDNQGGLSWLESTSAANRTGKEEENDPNRVADARRTAKYEEANQRGADSKFVDAIQWKKFGRAVPQSIEEIVDQYN